MNYISPVILFLLFSVISISAQESKPTPTPKPTPAVEKNDAKQNTRRSFSGLNSSRPVVVVSPARLRIIAGFHLKNLYRKPKSSELEAISPNVQDLRKYKSFLNNSDTGLIKLINDAGCSENTKIVVATNDCLKYSFPGAGSSFSFRTDSYRLRRLADLTFTENSFQATGNFLIGIFVNIGDVPIDKVSLNTTGVKFLREFKPPVEYEKAVLIDKALARGLKNNGFIYRRALYARENTTFVLRSIAYRGKSFRALRGLTYNELDFDKRRDITVAFRIVRMHADGSVSILWKKLSDQKAPKLKRRK